MSGALQVASLYAVISADDRMSGTLDAAEKKAIGFGERISRMGAGLTSLGTSLMPISAPLALFGATGIKAAASFEDAMTQISARTGLVGADLNSVSEFAQQMGAETIYSSQEAADALLELLSSGQSVEEAMSTLPGVMQAAAASGEGLGETADILTNVMAAYGLSIDRLPENVRALADSFGVTNEELVKFSMQGDSIDKISPKMKLLLNSLNMTAKDFYVFANNTEDTSTVVESLARAASASSADIAGLGQAFGNIGPVAANFGMSVDQTAATLAIFAENGIKGGEAGTLLKSMLLSMSRDTSDANEAWSDLGLSMYDANGNVKNMQTIMSELDTVLDQLPVEEQNKYMQLLGGSYGIVGLSALRAGTGIADMQRKMEDQASAATVADTMMDTFNNTIGSLGGSVETLQIAVFTPFINDVLKPLATQAITVVNNIVSWVKANPKLTSTIVAIGAGLAGLAPLLMGAGTLISTVGVVIGAVLSPVGLLVAGIAALGAAFSTNFMGIRDVVEPIIDRVIAGFNWLSNGIGMFVQDIQELGILDAIRQALGWGENADSWVEGVLVSFGMARETAEGLVNTLYSAFNTLVSFFQTTVLPTLQQLGNWFLNDVLPQVVSFVTGTVIPAIQTFFTFLGNVWSIVGPALGNLANWFLNEGLPAIQNFITGTVIPGIQGFIDTLVSIWNAVSPTLLSLFDWFINTGLPIVVGYITDVVVPNVQLFIDLLVGIWNAVSPTLNYLFDWFINTGLPIVTGFIEGPVTTIIQGFINLLTGIWNTISGPLNSFKDGIVGVFGWLNDNIFGPMMRTITGLIEEFAKLFGIQAGGTFHNNGGGAAALAAAAGVSGSTSGTGFASGGWTGDGSPTKPAGIVHGQEWVVPRQGALVMREAGNSPDRGGMNFAAGSIVIHANDEAGGRAAGRGFAAALEEKRRSRG